jgi:hypothetical protein
MTQSPAVRSEALAPQDKSLKHKSLKHGSVKPVRASTAAKKVGEIEVIEVARLVEFDISPALARLLAAHETQLMMAADHVEPEELIAALREIQIHRQARRRGH